MTSFTNKTRLPALIAAALVVVSACSPSSVPSALHILDGQTMGTTYSVRIAAAGLSSELQEDVRRAIEQELARIDELMSTYRPDSELSRFNQHRERSPFPLSSLTFQVFQSALELTRMTEGAFDVTVAPLVNAWGFGSSGPVRAAPSGQDIEQLRRAVGSHLLVLDEEASTVRKLDPKVESDFSAIAPGFAVDRLSDLLMRRGFHDFLIELGGELRGSGVREDGSSWRVAIERPTARGRSLSYVVPLSGAAIATSGDYRNYYELAGERVAHIIDPRTGRPIHHRLASATVIETVCTRADALSTALMVLGPEHGLAFAESQGLAALMIVQTGGGAFEEQTTTAFDDMLSNTRFD